MKDNDGRIRRSRTEQLTKTSKKRTKTTTMAKKKKKKRNICYTIENCAEKAIREKVISRIFIVNPVDAFFFFFIAFVSVLIDDDGLFFISKYSSVKSSFGACLLQSATLIESFCVCECICLVAFAVAWFLSFYSDRMVSAGVCVYVCAFVCAPFRTQAIFYVN